MVVATGLNGQSYGDGTHKFICGSENMLTAGVRAPFPPPVQAVVLTSKQIKILEDKGQLPSGLSKKIEDARAAASTCTDKLWAARFDAADRANTVANVTESTRSNRRQQLLDDYNAAVPKTCASAKKRFDQAFEAAISEYKRRRLALFESESSVLAQLAGTGAP